MKYKIAIHKPTKATERLRARIARCWSHGATEPEALENIRMPSESTFGS
jgi:hypothetical protein